eukprot:ANDGO_08491.mRNA.1 hypothetical protein
MNPSVKPPHMYLSSVLGKPCVVKLSTGSEFRGVLAGIDPFMNVVMEQTEEFDENGKIRNRYGDTVIRGNNVLYVTSAH